MGRRRWIEGDHPRHPGGTDQGGQFRERVGSFGWAMRLAGLLGRRRSSGMTAREGVGHFGEFGAAKAPMGHPGWHGEEGGPFRTGLDPGEIEDDEDMRPPWEGGPPDDDDHFLRQWQGRLNSIVRERGLEPEEVLPEDADELNSYYEQYQADPAELVDYLMEQSGLPGGRSDLTDPPLAEGDNFEQPGRLTNQEVASILWSANRPPPNRERDADPVHDNYNEHIVEEAIGAQEVNADDADAELDAQIELVQELRRRNKFSQWDEAVDHLRRMLTISYLDEDDLPPLPPGRRSGTSGV